MRTPAQRKASAEYAARRKARGDKLVRVWIDKRTQAALKKVCGDVLSIEQAIASALRSEASAKLPF